MNISFVYECSPNRPFRPGNIFSLFLFLFFQKNSNNLDCIIDGFACQGTDYTAPTGLSSFPSIFSYLTVNYFLSFQLIIISK